MYFDFVLLRMNFSMYGLLSFILKSESFSFVISNKSTILYALNVKLQWTNRTIVTVEGKVYSNTLQSSIALSCR